MCKIGLWNVFCSIYNFFGGSGGMKKFRFLLIFMLLFSFTLAYGSLPKPDSDYAAYIIKDGDSLWKITDRFYGNSFLWPRLWEINPYIDDPNVIYPGDFVSLYEDNLIKLNPKTRTDGLVRIDPPPPVFYYPSELCPVACIFFAEHSSH